MFCARKHSSTIFQPEKEGRFGFSLGEGGVLLILVCFEVRPDVRSYATFDLLIQYDLQLSIA
jgi:hypothetical protein